MNAESFQGPLPHVPDWTPSSSKPFKRCRYCCREWLDKDDFLNDPDVYLAGKKAASMKAFIAGSRQGLLVFVHRAKECGSTILVAPDALVARAHTL